MRIGFDISQTGRGKAGCGFFAHAMIEAMLGEAPGHRFALYPSFGDFYFDAAMPLTNPYPAANSSYGPRMLFRDRVSRFWNAPDLEARLERPDVVHANNFWAPVQLESSRLVYTCYDLGFTLEPSWTTEANRVGCFEGVYRSSVAADFVVAISEATRSHYLALFPHFPPERVAVVHPCSRFADAGRAGVRPAALRDVAPGKFWLTVGTIEPRKNQLQLARAYARHISMGGPAMPLVIAGGKGWLMDDFAQRLHEIGIAEHVILTGYVSDDELAWLYRNCLANLYPSRFEGFGLPVLEGMQFAAASIVSSSSSLPEVAGSAAILVDPDDLEGWANAMLRVAGDPALRESLRAQAKAQARRFDGRASARRLLEVYERAAAAPKRVSSAATPQ